jgi:hypothetical protein
VGGLYIIISPVNTFKVTQRKILGNGTLSRSIITDPYRD